MDQNCKDCPYINFEKERINKLEARLESTDSKVDKMPSWKVVSWILGGIGGTGIVLFLLLVGINNDIKDDVKSLNTTINKVATTQQLIQKDISILSGHGTGNE